ncbi:MAG TPA: AAA domain-containing protein [Bacteroidales bacterium]
MDFIKRIRVSFLSREGEFLLVEMSGGEKVRVRTSSSLKLWEKAPLNLLHTRIDEEGIYIPEFIILEPDYLLNVTSLSECYKDYGSHPLNFVLSKFMPVSDSKYILLGNTANMFLDELIYGGETGDVRYETVIRKVFKQYPFELTTCPELQTSSGEREFFISTKQQFGNIQQIVRDFFGDDPKGEIASQVILEPSFICEPLGIQGRLDLLMQDYSRLIELKSGKAMENWSSKSYQEAKQNHYMQILLYQAMLEFSMDVPHELVRSFLLYSRYPVLVQQKHSREALCRILDLRNNIIANEYWTQHCNKIEVTDDFLSQIVPDRLNESKRNDNYWYKYLRPSLEEFGTLLNSLSELERAYFMAIYAFVTKEQYQNQTGNGDEVSVPAITKLWNASLEEKKQADAIFYDLKMIDNRASEEDHTVTLAIPDYEGGYLPNFRKGDVVVLYERNNEDDRVSNKQVFKGSLESIDEKTLKVRLRNRQKNRLILSDSHFYALEHGYMDTTYLSMYRSLHYFMHARKERRDLLLAQRTPIVEAKKMAEIEMTKDDTERAVLKAFHAQDYFLLVGPPGTGKTSRALKQMIQMYLEKTEGCILLLSYTNRAVDEMCRTLRSISKELPFIRIGNELTADEASNPCLLENRMEGLTKRNEVRELIEDNRIFVGTVASISSKMSLFSLKSFEVAIIDEATQILEPHLLGIFSACTPKGENAIRRFVMIGDHKQLPAVVQQSSKDSEVHHPSLNECGISNLNMSLFERLYRWNKSAGNTFCYDMLRQQGRMHPVVASFANHYFYGGKLELVPLDHQLELLDYEYDWHKGIESFLAKNRIGFVPSIAEIDRFSFKSNETEAMIIAEMASGIVSLYERNGMTFDPETTLGIITPYRSQIAMIRKALQKKQISLLENVVVDTVERFQGGQRDIILYSFCVNNIFQLQMLSNEIEEDGVLIDRKLNVVLTRARKQLFMTGVPDLIKLNNTYNKLLNHVIAKGEYLSCSPQDFVSNSF